MQLPWDPAAIAAHIVQVCETYDTAATGYLPLTDFQAALRNADLHLSWLHIQAISAEAPVVDDTNINYVQFAPHAASLVRALLDAQVNLSTAQRVMDAKRLEAINGMTREVLAESVASALASVESNGRGTLCVSA